jgi:hypothetical protein
MPKGEKLMPGFRPFQWLARQGAGYKSCAQAAVLGSLLVALAAVPAAASATAWGPHDAEFSTNASAHGERPHALAPLNEANIVVTVLATGDSSVVSFDNVTPNYADKTCNVSETSLCLEAGYTAAFQIHGPSLQAGQVYDEGDGAISAAADDQSCSTSGDPLASGSVEVDQYVFTSGGTPIQAAAVQFDCTNAFVDISGTISYNIVPTDPGNGYYIFGQAGELTGFGNDNYLVYLNGAMYYNLNAPIVGMAPTPDAGGYWMVGSDGGGVRQRRCPVLRLDGKLASQQARGRHGRDP